MTSATAPLFLSHDHHVRIALDADVRQVDHVDLAAGGADRRGIVATSAALLDGDA